jgi:hypothetical protein
MTRLAAFALAISSAACMIGDGEEIDDSVDFGETEQHATSTNGVSINGVSINGVSINGVSINGSQLQGTSAQTGQPVTGAGMVGAQLTGTMSNGGAVKLRVDNAATLPAPNTDVWAYGVSFQVDGGAWKPLCGSATLPTKAVVIKGKWSLTVGAGQGGWIDDPASFTFACRGASIAKCVELGYKPWKTVGTTLLRNHHTACVRMLRGDYCGTGQAWTQDGNQVNVYDALGIQADTMPWVADAHWKSTGASCIRSTRILPGTPPSCVNALRATACPSFAQGTLLINEYKP